MMEATHTGLYSPVQLIGETVEGECHVAVDLLHVHGVSGGRGGGLSRLRVDTLHDSIHLLLPRVAEVLLAVSDSRLRLLQNLVVRQAWEGVTGAVDVAGVLDKHTSPVHAEGTRAGRPPESAKGRIA